MKTVQNETTTNNQQQPANTSDEREREMKENQLLYFGILNWDSREWRRGIGGRD